MTCACVYGARLPVCGPEPTQADSELIRDMIIERMNRLYVKDHKPRADEEFLTKEERKAMADALAP